MCIERNTRFGFSAHRHVDPNGNGRNKISCKRYCVCEFYLWKRSMEGYHKMRKLPIFIIMIIGIVWIWWHDAYCICFAKHDMCSIQYGLDHTFAPFAISLNWKQLYSISPQNDIRCQRSVCQRKRRTFNSFSVVKEYGTLYAIWQCDERNKGEKKKEKFEIVSDV